jgi:hypothetical protein
MLWLIQTSRIRDPSSYALEEVLYPVDLVDFIYFCNLWFSCPCFIFITIGGSSLFMVVTGKVCFMSRPG